MRRFLVAAPTNGHGKCTENGSDPKSGRGDLRLRHEQATYLVRPSNMILQ